MRNGRLQEEVKRNMGPEDTRNSSTLGVGKGYNATPLGVRINVCTATPRTVAPLGVVKAAMSHHLGVGYVCMLPQSK